MDQASHAVETLASTAGLPQPLIVDQRALEPVTELARATGTNSARQARGPRAFMAVALTLVAAAGLMSSALTYRAGRAWRDRAQTEINRTDGLARRLRQAEAQLVTALSDLAGAKDELTTVLTKLQRSEADVAALERRLQDLGTEKAQVEDEREASRDDRDRLILVTRLAARVEQELRGCVSGLDSWLSTRPSGLEYAVARRWSDWVGAGEAVARACNAAKVTNEQLRAAANG
jgi:septal ring factor EnvC (AmiA/AmiB activator)